jgi:hypothetical protein
VEVCPEEGPLGEEGDCVGVILDKDESVMGGMLGYRTQGDGMPVEGVVRILNTAASVGGGLPDTVQRRTLD